LRGSLLPGTFSVSTAGPAASSWRPNTQV
jgi:hypothetical protein